MRTNIFFISLFFLFSCKEADKNYLDKDKETNLTNFKSIPSDYPLGNIHINQITKEHCIFAYNIQKFWDKDGIYLGFKADKKNYSVIIIFKGRTFNFNKNSKFEVSSKILRFEFIEKNIQLNLLFTKLTDGMINCKGEIIDSNNKNFQFELFGICNELSNLLSN